MVALMFPADLSEISSERFQQLLPKLLNFTMKSFRTKNREDYRRSIRELDRIKDYFSTRIEKAFEEYIDPESKTSGEVKISAIQILEYETRLFIDQIRLFMRIKRKGKKFLQYPIPATINFLFYFLEKKKILEEILEFYLQQQEIDFVEQVRFIRARINDVYQTNQARLRMTESERSPYETYSKETEY